MSDFGAARSLGARIQAVRKARGFSVRELAIAVGSNPKQSTLENIEAGRKSSLDVVQLMNVAMALEVPIVYLLAPIGRPNALIDLHGLSEGFAAMTAVEFDSWLVGQSSGAYRSASLDERSSRAQLEALREWTSLRQEIVRLRTVVDLETSTPGQSSDISSPAKERLDDAKRAFDRISEYLGSAGWDHLPSSN